ncbi:flavohemoglobin expression-modulating QEGLA motif protein [Gillisia sp. Q332]|uniref:flavohemoglobin expression-modulating QEGLA motif protein n=1 Tax=Gillisia xinjiangensis TaxID=3384765 RepID=UPI0039195FD5
MLEISNSSDKSVFQILTDLKDNHEVTAVLPGGGMLHIEKDIPYLVVYRKKKQDTGISRLARSEASYLIIGDEEFDLYKDLLFEVTNILSARFNTYMILELYSGEPRSNTFLIKGPEDKLSSSLNILKTELENINEVYSGLYLQAKIKNTPHRNPEGELPLMEVESAKLSGGVVISLEIPPVFRNENGALYPVFFRGFRDYFIPAIHKFVYDFIRVQSSFEIPSYNALGTKYLKEKVFEIDRKLAEIEGSYQFLWLVSPANIQDIKQTFFDSNYEKLLDYHYRLLPIDPDVLKRELFNLKIEEIDDPAMSYLFREKREELDQQITMLNERGTKNFFYNSIRLYKGVERNLCEEARDLLNKVDEVQNTRPMDIIDSKAFSALARKEFDYFREQDENFKSRVHIRKDVNIMMVSQGELYIPQDYKMNRKESVALIQHEVGTHVLTYHNGSRQPLQQMKSGLADYDPLQEGLAVMAEYLVDGLTPNRLRTLAGRVVAGDALMEGAGFKEIFHLLVKEYGFSHIRSFNITSRIMQGGGFLKDIIYLKGLVDLRKYLVEGGDYEPLLSGKFGIKHTQIIKELTDRRILQPGVLRPSYLLKENVTEKIDLIRKGLPLSQMITT